MKFTLAPLPYAEDALEPVMSAQTVQLHYHEHHAGYVKKLNELLGADADRHESLEALIKDSAEQRQDVFNQAGQVWNHDFYWRSMRPASNRPQNHLPEPIGAMVRRDFGSVDKLVQALLGRADAHFGSGWLWLVLERDRLRVTTTANGRPAFVDGGYPLLNCDLWEHAYYIDYQNRRHEFVTKFLAQLANWEFAAERLETMAQSLHPSHAAGRGSEHRAPH